MAHSNAPHAQAKATVAALPPRNRPVSLYAFASHGWVARRTGGGDEEVAGDLHTAHLRGEGAVDVAVPVAGVGARVGAEAHRGRAARHEVAARGVAPQDLVAALGPAILSCCYEVGPEVLQACGIAAERPGRLDLHARLRDQLQRAGVPPETVHAAPWCTRCRGDLFFSFRREKDRAGRQMAVIGPSS